MRAHDRPVDALLDERAHRQQALLERLQLVLEMDAVPCRRFLVSNRTGP